MAFVSNSGYTGVVKRLVFAESEGSTSRVFAYMELGSGAGRADTETASSSVMTAVTASGLTRASLATATATTATTGRFTASNTVTGLDGDTGWFRHTWTCGTDTPAASIKECAVFNSSAGGDMLAYGTFPAGIPMGPGDTLQVTWSVQVKAGA
jgi:hypothetical protein